MDALNSRPFFESTEVKIESWAHFEEMIHHVQGLSGYNNLVWRGLGSSAFGLTHSLHRRLCEDLATPEIDEQTVQDAERMLIRDLRLAWNPNRNVSLIDVFARMQHRGAVSRFLDVTRDPYYALWFALWSSQKTMTDSRVVGFFVGSHWDHFEPMTQDGSGYPDWLTERDAEDEIEFQPVSVWFPSADIDVRLLVQKGGFIYGPMPKVGKKLALPAQEGLSEIRHHSSIDIEMVSLGRGLPSDLESKGFSFLVPGDLREDFLSKLDRFLGVNEQLMFPGFDGFIDSVRAAMTPIASRYGAEYPCC